jgi:hypothetical protein
VKIKEPDLIIKAHHRDSYAMILNSTLCDKRLSWKARGILCYLLSKPTDWRVIMTDLIRQAPDGKASVMAGIKELQTYGYVRRVERPLLAGKFMGSDIYVFETPDATTSENQPLTVSDFPSPVNQPLQIKEEQTTEIQIKEEELSEFVDVPAQAARLRLVVTHGLAEVRS